MRLAYYLLYAHIDDENTVVYLFQEELKDRKSNSFQGIGNTLNILTSILNQYNAAGKYDGILDEAKKQTLIVPVDLIKTLKWMMKYPR